MPEGNDEYRSYQIEKSDGSHTSVVALTPEFSVIGDNDATIFSVETDEDHNVIFVQQN